MCFTSFADNYIIGASYLSANNGVIIFSDGITGYDANVRCNYSSTSAMWMYFQNVDGGVNLRKISLWDTYDKFDPIYKDTIHLCL